MTAEALAGVIESIAVAIRALPAGQAQAAPAVLQGMTGVEVRRLDARGLLLYGLQSEPGSGPAGVRHRQAWACKPVVTVGASLL